MIFRKLLPVMAFVFNAVFTFGGGQHVSTEGKDFRSTTSRSDLGNYAVTDGSDPSVITDFIQKKIINLQSSGSSLLLTFSNASPGGYHYTFFQTYQGLPVFSSEIKVNVNRRNQVTSFFDDSYDVSDWKLAVAPFNYQEVAAYKNYISQYFPDGPEASAKIVIAYDETLSRPELCYQVNLKGSNGQHRNALVARDRIVYERDACMYRAAAAPDSLVTGLVFRPDPLTSAHKRYYDSYIGSDSAYQNFNNADTPSLNLQRVSVPFHANYTAGTFSLQNQYVRLQALGSNAIPPVTASSPVFNYNRSQLGFLDVMLFYHLNEMRDYIHGLGFGMADSLVIADSHALSADNDFFSQPNSIYYGTGGVADCQDADVIIHEYTHFLSWNANQSSGFGASTQRQSLDEGLGDYNASSYTVSIDSFGWERMFSWDGHNQYWNGRIVNDRTAYPAQPNVPGLGGIYKYGTTWASALMQIWWDIGRGPADSLFFEMMYGLAGNITLLDAAQVYIKADSSLYGGRYHCAIVSDFRDHGLATDANCGVYPLGMDDVIRGMEIAKFTPYATSFKVEAADANASIDVALYDITGQKISSYRNIQGEIKPEHLPAGIYIVDVSASGMHKGYKWALVK